MPNEYKSFWELRNHAEEMDHAYGKISILRLNEDGRAERKAYRAIVECFEFAGTKADVIQFLTKQINSLDNIVNLNAQYHMFASTKEDAAVADLLRKYIRHNFERDLWENIPEIASRAARKE